MLITNKPEELTDIVLQGGIIAYPTEAVFGLGCLADNEQSIRRLLSLKRRSADKGLILIASQIEQLAPYIRPLSSKDIHKIKNNDDKRAMTWIVPAAVNTSALLTGVYDTLAIRLTSHAPVQELCQHLNFPLISTSANLSHQPAAVTISQVKDYFSETIDGILNAPTGLQSSPSIIINLQTHEIIRN